MGFTDFLFETAGAAMRGYPKFQEMRDMYVRLQGDEKDVPVADFLEVYDLRIYDYSSKQDDIKLMKSVDFSGVYIIHNNRTGRYYYGVSEKLFRKVSRIFNGYEGTRVFSDTTDSISSFTLRLIDIDRTEFDNLDELKNRIEESYDGTFESIRGYIVTDTSSEEERKNFFILKEERKFFKQIYKIENNEEFYYGKSGSADSNGKVKEIKLYSHRDEEIGIIKRAQFKAPWDKRLYRDINISLQNEDAIKIVTKRKGLKNETIILPMEFYLRSNLIGSQYYVVDNYENVLITIKSHFDGKEIEFCDSKFKSLAIGIALSIYINREN